MGEPGAGFGSEPVGTEHVDGDPGGPSEGHEMILSHPGEMRTDTPVHGDKYSDAMADTCRAIDAEPGADIDLDITELATP